MIALLFGVLLGIVIGFITLCVIMLPTIIWRAFVMSKMWLWFAVPIFHVIPLGWVACIGLAAFIGMFTQHPDINKLQDEQNEELKRPAGEIFARMSKALFASFLVPAIVLLIGWLTKGAVIAAVNAVAQ